MVFLSAFETAFLKQAKIGTVIHRYNLPDGGPDDQPDKFIITYTAITWSYSANSSAIYVNDPKNNEDFYLDFMDIGEVDLYF